MPDGTSGRARAINNGGVIAGDIEASGGRYAVTWDAKSPFAVPVALATPKGRESHVAAINEKGLVVGSISIDDTYHAVVWDANHPTAPPKFLATPEGSECFACNINAAGQVVGCISGKKGGPVLWDANDPSTAQTWRS